MISKETITSVAIRDEYLKAMDEIKANLGLPKKYIINEAIKEYLQNHNFENIDF